MNKENQKQRPRSPNQQKEIKNKSQNVRVSSCRKSLAKNQQYQLYMRYLISANSDYFQNKMRVNPMGRSKEVQFKVPSNTGKTIYKRDYHKKQNKYLLQETIKHNMSVDCIKTNNFLKDEPIDLKMSDKTLYQTDFKYHSIRTDSRRKLKKRFATTQNEGQQAPRFLQTQNRLDFLKWAGKNYAPSMKPKERPATTNVPFEGKSVYKTEFEGKTITSPTLCIPQSNLIKFGCSSSLFKTSYSNDYPQKMCGIHQIDCKPKYLSASLCKTFKGTTEYNREFLKNHKIEKDKEEICPTVEELQTLIIDL